ncbi:MAG: L,D-transpeptidase family protein [Syntrophobacteraceae bacterium]
MILNGRTVRVVLIPVCLALISVVLCSCSLFQSRIKVPVAKTPEQPVVSQVPPACEQPYCSVDLDFPLTLLSNPSIYVLKGERRLWVVQDKVLVRDYTIGLGFSPSGDKYFRGDGRTPEGDYFICRKNGTSQYYKSIGINYPATRHAESGLNSGTISLDDYRQIVQANEAMKMPPANTALGGLIFIHGGGCHKDWTLGCVAVNNKAMDELFEMAKIGTPVHILP